MAIRVARKLKAADVIDVLSDLFILRGVPEHVRSDSTKVALVYKRTGNIRACQLLLGHTKLESTVRYLGIEVDDALILSEQTEI
ncbi:protein of unknown function [Methylorubrum extorquens]|uniref:Integrase n=1 Tax=Methylorubrum extorquens TaxID=408 RepID=A0A2N9AXV0_METEX|nr:protein of unknown function [Methylorubrum extorquens]